MALEQKRLLTYADYMALPDDGKRFELIDGELYVTPSPTYWHQKLSGGIYVQISNYLQAHPIGEVLIAPFDVILNPEETRAWQPDVVFVANERRHIIKERNIQGAPDLVVEVLSPGTDDRDLGIKKRAYQESGVNEYWVVWQTIPRVEVYRLNEAGRYGDPHLLEEDDTLTTDLLPGFSLEVSRLYAGRPAAE